MSGVISLRINLCSQRTVKTLQFQQNGSVHDACAEIRAKLGESVGGDDHALFWPEQAKWLQPNKALAFYDLKAGDMLEFKKKHRMLRVRLVDDAIKTVLIDDSLPAILLVQSVCSKIGIANADEYSFAVEVENPLTKTKKKAPNVLDDIKWLNPEKSLPEQGVAESDTVILRKKFFFSDGTIDRDDPVQLNLLFSQSRDAIISSKYPCTLNEAIQFAALQCQITQGTYDELKHRPGFLNLKEYLPEDYRKVKDVEKRIYAEHKKLAGINDLTLKYRYVQLCRSLKTYGVTFFLVKEKDPKKAKLLPCLIGITKESIMRVDAETKDVIKQWPLTSLRRWAASPNAFTMDFGDYQDAFYTVQTTQGELMSQLIGGYIDIIIKRKRDAEREIAQGEEETIVTEEVLRPARAQAVSIKPSALANANEIQLMQTGMVAQGESAAQMQRVQASPVHVASVSNITPVTAAYNDPAKSAVVQRVQTGLAAVTTFQTDMAMLGTLGPSEAVSEDLAQFTMNNMVAYMASHLAANNALVRAVQAQEHEAVATHVATLGNNLALLASACKALRPAEDTVLAATGVAQATGKMLETVQDAVSVAVNREVLLAGAQALTNAVSHLLTNMACPLCTPDGQKRLMEAAKGVSAATQDLVAKAKPVAAAMAAKDDQLRLIDDVKTCAAHASTVAVTSAMVAPLAAAPQCHAQLAAMAAQMDGAVEKLVGTAAGVNAADAVAHLKQSAANVHGALEALLLRAKHGDRPEDEVTLTGKRDKVLEECRVAKQAVGNTAAIIASVKSLTLGTTDLVNLLKRLAAAPPAASAPPNHAQRLLDLAKALAETTTRMVTVAKDAARAPGDTDRQTALVAAIDEIEKHAVAVLDPELHSVPDLLDALQGMSISAMLLSCEPAVLSNPAMLPHVKKVMEANRQYTSARNSATPRHLVQVANALARNVQDLLDGCRTAGGVTGAAAAQPSSALAQQLVMAAHELAHVQARTGYVAAIQDALELKAVIMDVDVLRDSIGALPADGGAASAHKPLDLAQVKAACKDLGAALAKLVGQATAKEPAGYAAAADGVKTAVVAVVKHVEALSTQDATVDLVSRSLDVLRGVQATVVDPAAKGTLVGAVKGLNETVAKLINTATEAAARVEPVPDPGQVDVREVVVNASSAMVTAVSHLVSAKATNSDIKKATADLEGAFRKLVSASKVVMAKADATARSEIVGMVQAASTQCVELITTAKSNDGKARDMLGHAAAQLGQSVNLLTEKCAVAARLGDVEVIRSLQALEMANARLSSPLLPTKVQDLTFSECLGKIVDDTRRVASEMTAAFKQPGEFKPVLLAEVCAIVTSIADTAMFSAALLSSMDITVLQPLVTEIARNLQMLETGRTQQDILDAASGVGLATNSLCQMLKARSAHPMTSDVERKEYVRMATQLASSTQHLISKVKAYAVNMDAAELKAAVVDASGPVQAAADEVYATATVAAPEIRESARQVVDTCKNLMLAKTADRTRILHHGAALGKSLSALVTTLRDVAPGTKEIMYSLEQLRLGMAEVDESLLQSAIEGVKFTLAHQPHVMDLAHALMAGTGEFLAVKDPVRSVPWAMAWVSLAQACMTDTGLLDHIKTIGDEIMKILEAIKANRTCDDDKVTQALSELTTLLELRDGLHGAVVAPLAASANGGAGSGNVLETVQAAAKDVVGLIAKAKTAAGIQPHVSAVLTHFRTLAQAIKECAESTSDVVLRDKLQGGLEKLAQNMLAVLVDRTKVPQLSSSITSLVSTVQETIRTSMQCQGAMQLIQSMLVPQCRDLEARLANNEPVAAMAPAVPGGLQTRCNQLLESLGAIRNASQGNVDSLLGDAVEGSVAILQLLDEEARKVAVQSKNAGIVATLGELLEAWSSLVDYSLRSVTKGNTESLVGSVDALADRITQLVGNLTSNQTQDEFRNLISALEQALQALPPLPAAAPASPDAPKDYVPPELREKQNLVSDTKNVASTAFDLIKVAALAQRVITTRVDAASAKAGKDMYFNDGTWSDGLISAAKQVAQAMQDLITCAATDGVRRERVIASAKAVSAATAQVVSAASVKVDASEPSLVRLKASAKQVVDAATGMAQRMATANELDEQLGEDLVKLRPSNQTSARLAMIEAETSVLAKERELQEARARLANVRKSRYTGGPDQAAT
ncbi:Talin-1 [Allomyces javanicus]|nr:Talin-1 [Allomyces javanicus]